MRDRKSCTDERLAKFEKETYLAKRNLIRMAQNYLEFTCYRRTIYDDIKELLLVND